MVILEPGDHVKVHRKNRFPPIWHHGIYVGHRTMVHFTDLRGGKNNARIRDTSFEEFCQGDQPVLVEYRNGECFASEKVVQLAWAALDTGGYNVAFENCEHFATWCKTGKRESKQVQTAVKAVLAGVAAGYVANYFAQAAKAQGRRGPPPTARGPAPGARRAAPATRQCKATTRSGSRCRRPAQPGNYGFCAIH